VDYVIEVVLAVWQRREQVRGMKLTHQAPFLRHFTAYLEPVEAAVVQPVACV
jgi:tryptophanase